MAIITGAGDRAFSAGHDLKDSVEMDKANPGAVHKTNAPLLYETMLETFKPVIAAVHGHCLGSGAEVALCCDIRIAADNTRYAFPEASRGLGARLSSVMLSRQLPHAIASEMLFTAEPYDLNELKRYGLINQIVPTRAVDGSRCRDGATHHEVRSPFFEENQGEFLQRRWPDHTRRHAP